jgi:hypothetical protein
MICPDTRGDPLRNHHPDGEQDPDDKQANLRSLQTEEMRRKFLQVRYSQRKYYSGLMPG